MGVALVPKVVAEEEDVEDYPTFDSGPRLVTFFARYPDGLKGVVTDEPHLLRLQLPLEGFTDLLRMAVHYEDDAPYLFLEPKHLDSVFVSIRFHSADRPGSTVDREAADLTAVLRHIAPRLVVEPVHAGWTNPDGVESFTVVEMVTPLVAEQASGHFAPGQPNESTLGAALTRSIEALQQLINAYRVMDSLLLPLPARERLGAIIPWGTRPADPHEGGWDQYTQQATSVLNLFALPGHQSGSQHDRNRDASQLGLYIGEQMAGFPSAAVMELQADADVARQIAGDFRSAIMLLYTASEVFMDALLMMMCWEEGLGPEDAEGVFANALVNRVRTQFHERLRGAWGTRQRGPVREWYEGLVLVRHRVAHAGLNASRDDADRAAAAHAGLRNHALNRLAVSLGKYPMTAAMLVTKAGFQRRGQWTRRAQSAVAGLDGQTKASFLAWRDALFAVRGRSDD